MVTDRQLSELRARLDEYANKVTDDALADLMEDLADYIELYMSNK